MAQSFNLSLVFSVSSSSRYFFLLGRHVFDPCTAVVGSTRSCEGNVMVDGADRNNKAVNREEEKNNSERCVVSTHTTRNPLIAKTVLIIIEITEHRLCWVCELCVYPFSYFYYYYCEEYWPPSNETRTMKKVGEGMNNTFFFLYRM